MMDITKDIFGKLYGDKGYISKAMADTLGKWNTDGDQTEKEHERYELKSNR